MKYSSLVVDLPSHFVLYFGSLVFAEHRFKFSGYFLLEVILHLVDVGELGEGPAAEALLIVHSGNPVGVHRGLLLLGVFLAVAFDLDDEVERVFGAMAVVDEHDEVGDIFAAFGQEAVGHL